MIGNTFGRLEVIGSAPDHVRRYRRWTVRCVCGEEFMVLEDNLKAGKSQSCGCLNRERTSQANRRHGRTYTRTWNAWTNMRKRCAPGSKWHVWYAARGIKVCQRWVQFENFYTDMGECPPKYSIDRIDVNGDYELSNCRWATWAEQMRNRRSNHYIECNGDRLIIEDWARKTGIPSKTIHQRIRYGWSEERAVSTPVRWMSTLDVRTPDGYIKRFFS